MNAIVQRVSTPAVMRPILVPQTFDQLMIFAEKAAESELVPNAYRNKPSNIMIAVQMGSELGLSPMQSLNSIAVIGGRPGIWGDGLIGICRASSLCQDIVETIEGEGDAREATCIATRRGSSPTYGQFSVADAKRANLWGKAGPWTQYPDRMLKNRARSFSLRDAFPDLLRGLKGAEELMDTPPDNYQGTTIDARSEPAQPRPQPVRPKPAEDTIPDFNEPVAPVDKAATGANRLIALFVGCGTLDELRDHQQNAEKAAWMERMKAERPELHTRIVDAIRTTYAKLAADEETPLNDAEQDEAGEP